MNQTWVTTGKSEWLVGLESKRKYKYKIIKIKNNNNNKKKLVKALILLRRRTGGVGPPEAGRKTLVKRNVDAETNLRVIFGGVQHQLALGLLQRRVRLWFGCEGGEREGKHRRALEDPISVHHN